MNARLLTIMACSLPMAALPLVYAAIPVPVPAPAVLLDDVVDVEGAIISVDHQRNTFAVENLGEHVPLRVDDDTKFTLDGDPSSFEGAVQTGRHARVTHKDGTAVSVDVHTHR